MIKTFKKMGPAWIISAVACGPATLASLAMAGSTYGFALLWVVILSAVFACVAQYLAARVGILSGKGIITLVEEEFGTTWSWILTIDALLCTWLASTVLMKALTMVSGYVTGWESAWWSLIWAVVLACLVGVGGYRWLEKTCQILVVVLIGCFLLTLLAIRPSFAGLCSGFVPNFPNGAEAALMAAGIMGGAVHVTILSMHTYTVNRRSWKEADLPLAKNDTIFSMLIAFGLYSLLIFLLAATVERPQGGSIKGLTQMGDLLRPLLGSYSGKILLLGLWAAVITTICPTFLAAAYLLGDKLGWDLKIRDKRFQATIFFGCLLSLLGPHLGGGFAPLLTTMLALGLCGTPLILILILILLNRRRLFKDKVNPLGLNIAGALVVVCVVFLAANFLRSKFF